MKIRHAPVWRFWRGSWQRQSLYSQQSQKGSPEAVDVFGGLSNRAAHQQFQQFGQPLGALFGFRPAFGAGPRGQRQESRYNDRLAQFQQGGSPLAQFAQQAMGFLPQVFGQAQGVGQRIATEAPGIYDALRAQIGAALKQLPGIQNTAQGQVGAAQQFLNQAQSPVASQALYQDALRNALEGSRGGAAGRGLLDAGASQANEETLGRDLASQFAQRRFGEQQQALGGVQQALGTQAGLLPVGAQLAGAQGAGLQQLGQALAQGYQLPQEAIQQLFQQFAAFQNPNLALAQLTAPQIGQRTEGGGFGILSVSGSKYPVVYWVGF